MMRLTAIVSVGIALACHSVLLGANKPPAATRPAPTTDKAAGPQAAVTIHAVFPAIGAPAGDPDAERAMRQGHIDAEVARIRESAGDLTDDQVAAISRLVAAAYDARLAFYRSKECADVQRELGEAIKSGDAARQSKAQKDYQAAYAIVEQVGKKFAADLTAILTPEQDLKYFMVRLRAMTRDRGAFGEAWAKVTDEQIKKIYDACQGLDESARFEKATRMFRGEILTPEQHLIWLKAEMDVTLTHWSENWTLTDEQRGRVKAKLMETLEEMQKTAKAAGRSLVHGDRLTITKKAYDFVLKEVLTDEQKKAWEARIRKR